MALQILPRIQKAARRLAWYLDRFRTEIGVTQADAQVLAYLAAHGPSAISRLQRTFGSRPSTLTSVLDRLAAAGYIIRDTHPEDRRSFLVRLTPRGRRVAARIRASLETLERRVRRRVRRQDAEGFLALLAALEELADGK